MLKSRITLKNKPFKLNDYALRFTLSQQIGR